MRIDELFDQPLPLKWSGGTTGRYYRMATFQIDKKTIHIEFSHDMVPKSNIWTVTFGSPETVLGRSAKMNVGSKTILIFSTVLEAIDQFFAKINPDSLIFVAATPSLLKLYERMIKYINSKGKYHVELMSDYGGGEFHYEITK